jgi:lipoyl(octanoyl) transferase
VSGRHLISVLDSGQLDYATGLRLQQRLVDLRKQGRVGDILVLLEHSPVLTLGRNAKTANILASPELLARRGIEVFECDRGGDVTFHGPGQLVAYPIFDLHGFPSGNAHRRTMGVVEFVRCLEEVLIRTCAEFGIPAKRIPGLTGVWTPGETGGSEEAKIAALGVHVSSGITSHGVALNVNTDLSFFDLIVPCGIPAKPVTSMARELGRMLALTDVAHALGRSFGTVFNSQVLWLDSLDALFGSTLGIPMRVPENLRKIRGEDESASA